MTELRSAHLFTLTLDVDPNMTDVGETPYGRRRIAAVQVAPATRIAISEEFGMAPGTVSTGRLVNALRQLGFDYVFDSNFGADLTIMEEGTELLVRNSGTSKSQRNVTFLKFPVSVTDPAQVTDAILRIYGLDPGATSSR